MTHTKQELLLLCNEIKNNLKIIKNSYSNLCDISIEVVCDECDHEFEVDLAYNKYSCDSFDLNLNAIERAERWIMKKNKEIEEKVEGLREDIPGQILMEGGVV
jgi:hypothetical protein